MIEIATGILMINYYWGYFYFPSLPLGLLKVVDLTFGLALVALSEELVYRRLMHDVIESYTTKAFIIYFASSLIFAILHVPQDLERASVAFFAGFVLMHVYKSRGLDSHLNCNTGMLRSCNGNDL